MKHVSGCVDGGYWKIGPKWLCLLAARADIVGCDGTRAGWQLLMALCVGPLQASLTFVRLV